MNFMTILQKYIKRGNFNNTKEKSELECDTISMNLKDFSGILDENDNFTFGKYAGLKVSDVIKVDPEYIIWCDINLNYVKFKLNVIKMAESSVITRIRCCLVMEKKKREMYDNKSICNTDTIFDDDNDSFH